MATSKRPAFGVLGMFFTLLGAGIILDADRVGWGMALIASGAAGLLVAWREPAASAAVVREERPPA
jgi:hypothetical protein